MELRNGKQIPDGGNFRGLFPTTPGPGEVLPETIANAIHSTPASQIITGTPTPRLTALRQAVRQVTALSSAGGAGAQASGASTPATAITDTPRPGQSGSATYTMAGNHGARTISSTSNYSHLHNFRTSNNDSSMNDSDSNNSSTSTSVASLQPHMPNVIRLPNYNQKQSAIQWWVLFCQWVNFFKMSDAQAIAALPFYLDIIPQQWFFQLSGAAKSSLSSLKDAFLSRFSVKKANFDVNLFHIQQNSDESVEDYLARVYKLTNEYEVPNHLLVGITIQGLKPEIRKIVMPQKPENLEQLREAAMVAERTVTSTGSISDTFAMSLQNMEDRLMSHLSDKFEASLAVISQTKYDRPRSHQGQNNTPNRRPFRNFRPDFRQNQQNERKCQGCGGTCVDRRQCRAKGKTCHKCKKLNHFASVCRSGIRTQLSSR